MRGSSINVFCNSLQRACSMVLIEHIILPGWAKSGA
jgi:hypothetical protein